MQGTHVRRLVSLVLAAALASCGAEQDQFRERDDVLRVVMLPDTQCYTRYAPEVLEAQATWIADNADRLGIAHVVHVGDITDTNSPDEWENARTELLGLLPFSTLTLTTGNHDLGELGRAASRSSPIDDWFTAAELGVDGTQSGSVQNSYTLVGDSIIVLGLEFAPRLAVVEWAAQVLDAHPERHAIVVTHAYLDERGERYDRSMPHPQAFSPYEYGVSNDDVVHDGEELWRELIATHENVALVLSGHVPRGFGVLESEGEAGNTVVQLMADYQRGTSCDPAGTDGDGYLIVLDFPVVPGSDEVVVRSYSPYLGRFHPRHGERLRDWRR